MTNEDRIAALEQVMREQAAEITRLANALAGYTTPNAVSNALMSQSLTDAELGSLRAGVVLVSN